MATLNIDVQIVNFSFLPALTPAEAEATLIPHLGVISAVDLTRAYHQHSAHNTGSFRCQGVLPHFPAFHGSTCSGLAVPPAPGPIGVVGDLGDIVDGKISEWRLELTSPTTAVIERSGSPVPIAPPGCAHFFHTKLVEYL